MKPETHPFKSEQAKSNAELLAEWTLLLPDLTNLLAVLDSQEIHRAHNQLTANRKALHDTPKKTAQTNTSRQLTLIHLEDPDYAEKENALKNSIADFKRLLEEKITAFTNHSTYQIPALALALNQFCDHKGIKSVPLSAIEINTSDNALKLGYNLLDITAKLEFFIQCITNQDINPHRKLRPGEKAPERIKVK